MGHDEIPRDRIQRRAQRIIRIQRQRDAQFTVTMTWSSIATASGTALVALLLVTGLVSMEALVVAPVLLNLAQAALAGWLHTRSVE
ncbi:hypothetical protein [Streptomyces sp. NPDC058308]|uniref:hypothetical protein n=1 Tax=Streptomyces sp. NPDC058308 TaxID=3346440 RepID=UPI0036ED5DA2